MFKKIRFQRWYDYVVLFLIIIVSNKSLFFGTNEIATYASMGAYFPVILLPLLFYKNISYKGYVVRGKMDMAILLIILIFLSSLANSNLRIGCIFYSISIIAGFIYAKQYEIKTFLRMFDDITIVIAIYSVIIYTIVLIIPAIVSSVPIVTNSQGYVFANFGLCTVPLTMKFIIPRLFGPFSEPGIFQIYLNLAICFHILSRKDVQIWRIVVYLVALVLTFSTTGYIACGCVFAFIYFYNKENHNNVKNLNKLLFLIIVGMVVLSIYTDILTSDGVVFNKFGDSGRGTTAARMGSIYGNLSIWYNNPIFGVGITALTGLFEQYCIKEYGVSTQSNTNSLLIPFAMFGFVYGCSCIYCIWKYCKNLVLSKRSAIVLFASIVVMLSGENITENVLFYILIGYGVCYINKKEIWI